MGFNTDVKSFHEYIRVDIMLWTPCVTTTREMLPQPRVPSPDGHHKDSFHRGPKELSNVQTCIVSIYRVSPNCTLCRVCVYRVIHNNCTSKMKPRYPEAKWRRKKKSH
uniref:Uncharacterized protein n=1 Tax=Cacopsylla melanoneura TaxID=428564 RepID=A0A8D8XY82_9HEMI